MYSWVAHAKCKIVLRILVKHSNIVRHHKNSKLAKDLSETFCMHTLRTTFTWILHWCKKQLVVFNPISFFTCKLLRILRINRSLFLPEMWRFCKILMYRRPILYILWCLYSVHSDICHPQEECITYIYHSLESDLLLVELSG